MPDTPHGRRAYDTPSVLGLVIDTLNRVESKLDSGLARVEEQLAGKASRTDLARIEGTLAAHAERIGKLEEKERISKARADVHHERDERSWFSRKNKWAIAATALTVVATLTLAVVSVVQVLHG